MDVVFEVKFYELKLWELGLRRIEIRESSPWIRSVRPGDMVILSTWLHPYPAEKITLEMGVVAVRNHKNISAALDFHGLDAIWRGIQLHDLRGIFLGSGFTLDPLREVRSFELIATT